MRLLIRADGDRHIGIGHVMRMMALAESVVSAGGTASLASTSLEPALAARVGRHGAEVIQGRKDPGSAADAEWLLAQAERMEAEWMAVDGDQFGAEYLERLHAARAPVLLVDDYAERSRYPALLVLNPNLLAAPERYPPASGARYLLGPEYALLRREVATAASVPRVIRSRGSRLLITMGGADPPNAGRRILDAVRLLPDADLEIRMLIGPSNPHRATLDAGHDPRVTILPAVDHTAPHMAWADLAITAAGGTVYELACLGVPALVVAIAEYQRELLDAITRERLGIGLGWHEAVRPSEVAAAVDAVLGNAGLREELSRRGHRMVDGRGVGRVIAAMETG